MSTPIFLMMKLRLREFKDLPKVSQLKVTRIYIQVI